ncbi:hypothetical protein J6590_087147 [Homalodisca vitripennis]|nr:hypothetical protein J6590_087147 [Homalodisca vitripennis]
MPEASKYLKLARYKEEQLPETGIAEGWVLSESSDYSQMSGIVKDEGPPKALPWPCNDNLKAKFFHNPGIQSCGGICSRRDSPESMDCKSSEKKNFEVFGILNAKRYNSMSVSDKVRKLPVSELSKEPDISMNLAVSGSRKC